MCTAMLTWSELNEKLHTIEEEKARLMCDAASATETLRAKLQHSEDAERRLRSEIRAAEMDSLRKQHAALKTSLYHILLVGWLSGRTSVSDRRTFTGLHRTCS